MGLQSQVGLLQTFVTRTAQTGERSTENYRAEKRKLARDQPRRSHDLLSIERKLTQQDIAMWQCARIAVNCFRTAIVRKLD